MEKPESGIRSGKQKRNRNWILNPNPNLRNKNWRRFCLESVTNNYCSIKTFHPHIIFIYCYYIFYCRVFCVRRKIFLQEFHIRVSVATWDHDWLEYSSSLCRLSRKKIKVFILFRFTEFEKMINWNVSTCENVKLLCLEFMLESAAEQHGLILWILVVMFFFFASHFLNVSIPLVSRSLCWKFLKTMITEDAVLNFISTRVSGTGFSAS